MKTAGVMPEAGMRNREVAQVSTGNQREAGMDSKQSFSSLMSFAQNKVATRYEPVQTNDMIKLASQNKPLEVKDSTNKTIDVKKDTEEYAKEIKEKVKKLLQKSEQEVEDLLEKLGLTAMDLLNPENLTAFLLESFEASSVEEALLNEGLSEALLASSSLLSGITEEIEVEALLGSNLKAGEELDSQLDGSLGQMENVSQEDQVQVEFSQEGTDSKRDGNLKREGQETFMDVLVNKADLSSIQAEEVPLYESKQIVSQLVDQIRLNISQTKTSMELVLNPEALGKVQVMVQTKAGVLTARFTCENEITKEALESSLQILKESFEEQGLKVEKVEVTIGNYTSEYEEQEGHAEEQGKHSSNKKIRIDDYTEDEVEEKEQVGLTPSTSLNGTIEYMA